VGSPEEATKRRHFPKALIWIGVPIVMVNALLAARLVWEQTLLTWQHGPQMIGFSLMHVYPVLTLIAFVGLFGGYLWAAAMFIAMIVARSFGGRLVLLLCALYAVTTTLQRIPYQEWQFIFADRLAKGPKGADFATSAAVHGNTRLVARLLDGGVPINATTREGRTALHLAAFGGKVETIDYLLSRGADVNAISLYGDSPLGEALAQNQKDAAKMLESHGGKDIRGTPEQRNSATKRIVSEDIAEMSERRFQ
jgi:hypothetical protein